MSFSDAWRLLARHWVVLALVPLVLGVSAYFFSRRLPKVYSSDTTIYTGIASGYTLAGDAAADYNATNNAFDNLINLITARSTKEEVSYRLLATHLFELGQEPALASNPPYSSLQATLPPSIRQHLLAPTKEATLDSVRRYARANTSNPVYQLLNSADPTYSLTALQHLSAARIGLSDLVRLEYESYNPEVCRYTLELATRVVLDQSRNLREGQTASVVQYYEEEVARAKEHVTKAENASLAFNRTNNIVDYDAQASNITNEKETLAGELTQVNQQYAGATAVLQAVNQKMGKRESSVLNSRQVVEQRQKLGRLNSAIADEQLFNRSKDGGTSAKAKELQAEADRAAQTIQSNVDSYYAQNTSAEGIPSKELMGEWVQSMVQVESNRAKLNVMRKRLADFDQEYQRMAPLGATIKRLERETDLAEKAYLAALSSLNASKASMQNTQLTSKLKIVDAPNTPTGPKNGKLLPIVLLSSMGGFVFVAGLVLGLGLLDKSLRTPAAAAKQTGLPVAGVLLDVHATPPKLLQASQQRSLGQLVRHILLQANTPPLASPFVVGIFSVQHQESRTTLCQELSQRCYQMGVQTLALYPDTNDTTEMLEAPSLFYSAEIAATRGWPLEDLIQHAMPKHMQAESSPQVQVVLVEFPALRESILPVGVLRQLNLVFLAVPADRPWRLTDHQTVERLRAATPAPVEVVLFGVAPQHRRRGVAARPTALRPLPFPYPVAGSYPMKPSPSLSSVLLNSRWLPLGAVAGALGAGWLVGQSGLLGSAALLLGPLLLAFVLLVFYYPRAGFITFIIYCFAVMVINRHIDDVPFGLGMEALLLLTWLAVAFHQSKEYSWHLVQNDLCKLTLAWFILNVLELGNPAGASPVGWFYEMRGSALYWFLTVPLAFLLFNRRRDLRTFLWLIIGLSVLGTLYGVKQHLLGVDSMEQAWLDAGAYRTHVLWGQLRVFSFYSEAAQFGSSQAHIGLICLILALGPYATWKRVALACAALLLLYGMLISGTRGAMFVFVVGGFIYLALSKQVKVLIVGSLLAVAAFGVLKYTYIGNNNINIVRLRTSLNPDDPSLQVRIKNQAILREYLASRPLGGGVGSIGMWGTTYNPGKFLSTIAPDSYFVKVWAEYGIIGFLVWLGISLYILGKCCGIVWNIRDPGLRQQLLALTAGYGGILVCSYGNEIMNQMPSATIIYISWVFVFLGPKLDQPKQLSVSYV